jgi:hypothetical protein
MQPSRISALLRHVAVLSSLVLGLLAAGGASAQPCGDLDEVPEEVHAGYLELLGEFFPLPLATCEKLVKTVVAGCHRTVSSSASCVVAQIRGVAKAGRTACAAQGAGQEECVDDLDAFLSSVQAATAARAREEHAECDEVVAPQMLSLCFGPG